MPLETGTTISNLDNSWPLGGDPTNKGDDHLRLIKSVLKTQFPGLSGNGFAIPITAKETEINFLAGVTANIHTSITNLQNSSAAALTSLYAPVATKMMFYQAAAPTGWTQVLTFNDYMMRVVNTAGGGSGGTDSPISKTLDHTHTTSGHALTIAEMPNHNHGGTSSASPYPSPDAPVGAPTFDYGATIGSKGTSYIGGGAPHSHGITGISGPTFTPKYLNVIIASKN